MGTANRYQVWHLHRSVFLFHFFQLLCTHLNFIFWLIVSVPLRSLIFYVEHCLSTGCSHRRPHCSHFTLSQLSVAHDVRYPALQSSNFASGERRTPIRDFQLYSQISSSVAVQMHAVFRSQSRNSRCNCGYSAFPVRSRTQNGVRVHDCIAFSPCQRFTAFNPLKVVRNAAHFKSGTHSFQSFQNSDLFLIEVLAYSHFPPPLQVHSRRIDGCLNSESRSLAQLLQPLQTCISNILV